MRFIYKAIAGKYSTHSQTKNFTLCHFYVLLIKKIKTLKDCVDIKLKTPILRLL